ncbi:hypothetical protein WQQ_15330 [Hydrocarboniphaga effusa AP103]|uniref:Transposase n=1 Tax=Hydrocarboniphaga effusa AP103 TaxID=1172194 RepID=I8I518_9GAMM|nr:hypothetical protein WQQ_15330 [Hydrocarboniphaga effusa AP103]
MKPQITELLPHDVLGRHRASKELRHEAADHLLIAVMRFGAGSGFKGAAA